MRKLTLPGASSEASLEVAETAVLDRVIVEEPLEMLLDGETLAITMRTPGADRELALGFAYSEGLIASSADLASVEVRPGRDTVGKEISSAENGFDSARVELVHSESGRLRAESLALDRRLFPASSACGLCGRRSLEDLWQRIPMIEPPPIDDATLTARLEQWLPAMRRNQKLFAMTGGCHAAALFDLGDRSADGEPRALFEDVGRHNAVDKIVGWAFERDLLPLSDFALVTSARAGFEIVQKAATAGLPLVVALGAASSLAVEMASFAGLRLWSFAASRRINRHLRGSFQNARK